MAERDKASVGIVTAVNTRGYVARVRLFRAGALVNSEPIEGAAITQIIQLPPISAEGIVDITADMSTDTVGTPSGTFDAPIAATLGLPHKGRVGTWAPAQRKGCTPPPNGKVPDGMVCVPGGAFWMGNTSVTSVLESVDANVPRLVVVSPFYLGTGEVIVSKYRDSGVARQIVAPDFSSHDDPQDSGGSVGRCTFSSVPRGGTYDSLPVNCLTWQAARNYCQSLGADLPTEAQWEYAAGDLASSTYPWGEDEPTCADAVFARFIPSTPLNCNPTNDNALHDPILAGSGARDRVLVGPSAIVDLAGNLREWVLDDFAPQGSTCWSAPLSTDPVCVTKGDDVVVRGASWHDQASFLRAATRHIGKKNGDFDETAMAWSYYYDDYQNTPGHTIGFRCALRGAP